MTEDLQEKLNSLPVNIQRKEKETCYSCGNEHLKTINYELKIDVIGHDCCGNFQHRYKIYYKYANGINSKYIGEPCGIGKLSLSESIDDLLTYLKEFNNDTTRD